MKPGSHLCMDLFYGPADGVLTRHKYGMVITDRVSRKMWVVTGRYKSDLPDRAVGVLKRIRVASGNALKEVRGDRGTENIFGPVDRYLAEVGASWRPSPPYEPRLNPAETFVNILKRGMRCLLVQAGVPDSYWVPAAETAAVLHNIRPRARTRQSPDAAFGSSPFNIDRLRVFGCLAFPLTQPRSTVRSTPHVMLGYGPMGYILGELTRDRWNGKIFVSNSVSFNELSFPCKHAAFPQPLQLPQAEPIADVDEEFVLDHKSVPPPDVAAAVTPLPPDPPAYPATPVPAGSPPPSEPVPATPPPPHSPGPLPVPFALPQTPAPPLPSPPKTESLDEKQFPSVDTPPIPRPATPPRRSARLANGAASAGVDRFEPLLEGKSHASSRVLNVTAVPEDTVATAENIAGPTDSDLIEIDVTDFDLAMDNDPTASDALAQYISDNHGVDIFK